MSSRKSQKVLKFAIGVLLLPCCVGITLAFFHQLGMMGRSGGLLRDWRFLCLALGFALWLIIYAVLPQPARLYVLGHELTHALWGLMMGAKVRGLKATAKGGQVTLSRSNFLITLAPYFFPFYCMLVIAVFLLGDLLFDWRRFVPTLSIAIGLCWAFHLTFTIATLSRSQTDVTQHGWLFSMTIIYWMNLLVLGLMLAVVTSNGNVWAFAKLVGRSHVEVWTWLFRAVRLMFG